MKRLATAWNAHFFAEGSDHRIAAVRVLVGLYVLVYFGAQLPDAALSYSYEGVYSPYLLPDYAPSAPVAYALLAALLACGLALTLGYRTRIATPTLLALFAYHYFLGLGEKQSAFDRLLAIDLLILCFADSGRVLGLDARRPGPPLLAWPERMLALQTFWLYLGPGLWKLFTPSWHTGVLLKSNLQGMFATPLAFSIVRLDLSQTTWAVLSCSVIAFELAMVPLLVVRRTRTLALLLGFAFHALNCVVLVIPEFLLSLAAYPVFVDEPVLRRIADRARAVLRRRAPAAAHIET
jgi:vitamin K-dependent gamma-carboxylase